MTFSRIMANTALLIAPKLAFLIFIRANLESNWTVYFYKTRLAEFKKAT